MTGGFSIEWFGALWVCGLGWWASALVVRSRFRSSFWGLFRSQGVGPYDKYIYMHIYAPCQSRDSSTVRLNVLLSWRVCLGVHATCRTERLISIPGHNHGIRFVEDS